MQLQWIDGSFAVCKIRTLDGVRPDEGFWFLARTDEELSLVCPEASVPANAMDVECGWRMFRVAGAMDFGLTGILAGLSGALAEAGVPIFAVSTYNTDYILIKTGHMDAAETALITAGHSFVLMGRNA